MAPHFGCCDWCMKMQYEKTYVATQLLLVNLSLVLCVHVCTGWSVWPSSCSSACPSSSNRTRQALTAGCGLDKKLCMLKIPSIWIRYNLAWPDFKMSLMANHSVYVEETAACIVRSRSHAKYRWLVCTSIGIVLAQAKSLLQTNHSMIGSCLYVWTKWVWSAVSTHCDDWPSDSCEVPQIDYY